MNQNPPPEDLHALVRLLLGWSGCTQSELASQVNISSTTLGSYRTGGRTPSRTMIERIAKAVGMPLFVVDFFLLPGIAARRLEAADPEGDSIALFERLGVQMQGISRKLAEEPVGIGGGREDPDKGWLPADEVRQEARDLWDRLARCDEEDRRRMVERWREFQHPGLAELLCHLSEEAASDGADRALQLARLARRVAELAPGDPSRKLRLLGYTLVYQANAIRVSGHLREAREELQKGLALWAAGEGASTFLAEWRLWDLEASLLRDEREFGTALARLHQAFRAAPAEHKGRILLKKSAVLEQMGDGRGAIRVLHEAKSLIHPTRQPQLFLTYRFNLATSFCLLDRFYIPERMLPKIQSLAAQLGHELTNVRVEWLAGRIHAGKGRLEEATASLEEVRRVFTRLSSPWDSSLVTLELATVHLRQGRSAEVKEIADQLVWVFEAQGIHLEALAALTLFRKAAQRETATVDFTQRLARYLRRAQGNPKLRFRPKTLP